MGEPAFYPAVSEMDVRKLSDRNPVRMHCVMFQWRQVFDQFDGGRVGVSSSLCGMGKHDFRETNLTILNQTNSTPAIFDPMYNAQLNGKSYEIAPDGELMLVNSNSLEWDLTALDNGQYHIRYKNKSYPAELVKLDKATKTVEIKVLGQKYVVQIRDKVDLLLEKMGMNAAASGKVNTVKAPMPGLIIDLRVKAGDTVKAGDPLLILEAMKMENIIKAAGEDTVKTVKVKKGDSVEKGQVLIEF